jgi:hypothetical protein
MASSFLTSALDEDELSASHPDLFTSEESAPDTHWIGGPGGTQSRPGRHEEEKNLLPLVGI